MTPKVEFLNLKDINRQYQDELKQACERVIDSGWYINGHELESFETNFSQWCGNEFCVGVGNGFDALNLIIRAWKEQGLLSDGDEVIVQANTFIASVLAIVENGLVPVFADPCEKSFNLNIHSIESVCTEQTKVIMPVHLYGQISPMKEICIWAKARHILVLEDAAQAHGASIDGCKAGSWGDASAFSFYPGKVLGALGDGGAVVTSDRFLARKVRALANYGSEKKYTHSHLGVNSRLDEMQAAILNIKLQYLDQDIQQRRAIAKLYSASICHPLINTPACSAPDSHVWHLYVVRSEQRDSLMNHLSKNGIETLIHYPIPVHKQECLKVFNHLSCPVSELLSETVLSLPISPVMGESQVGDVIDCINQFESH